MPASHGFIGLVPLGKFSGLAFRVLWLFPVQLRFCSPSWNIHLCWLSAFVFLMLLSSLICFAKTILLLEESSEHYSLTCSRLIFGIFPHCSHLYLISLGWCICLSGWSCSPIWGQILALVLAYHWITASYMILAHVKYYIFIEWLNELIITELLNIFFQRSSSNGCQIRDFFMEKLVVSSEHNCNLLRLEYSPGVRSPSTLPEWYATSKILPFSSR